MFQGAALANPVNIVGGQVTLGGEGIVFNNNAATTFTNVDTVLVGTGGLTLGGTGGTLVLPAASPNLSGNTNLNAGTINLGSAASVASGNLTIDGTVTLTPIQALTFGAGQSVTLNNTSLTFAAGGNSAPITFNGVTSLVGNNTLTLTNTGGFYFDGQVTGSGELITAGAGTVFLTNPSANNSFSGGTSLGGTPRSSSAMPAPWAAAPSPSTAPRWSPAIRSRSPIPTSSTRPRRSAAPAAPTTSPSAAAAC